MTQKIYDENKYYETVFTKTVTLYGTFYTAISRNVLRGDLLNEVDPALIDSATETEI